MTTEERRFFLSHSSEDKAFATRVASDLRDRGIAVWLDEEQIKVGDSLVQKVREGLSDCAYLVVILCPRSVRSRWVKMELDTALEHELERRSTILLPVLYEDCDIPAPLRTRLYADFTVSYERGLATLLRAFSVETVREMVFVPPGPFLYGPSKESVNIEYGYWVDVYPVTNGDFLRFMRDNGYRYPEYLTGLDSMPSITELLPVTYVNIDDAREYCLWRTRIERRCIRLPTEKEWEKAARDTDGRPFPWGDDDTKYWYCNCIEYNQLERRGARRPTPVDSFPANVSPFGCRDMSGNVFEWISSTYDKGPGVGNEVRGGSWGNELTLATCCAAVAHFCLDRCDYVGFRCVAET